MIFHLLSTISFHFHLTSLVFILPPLSHITSQNPHCSFHDTMYISSSTIPQLINYSSKPRPPPSNFLSQYPYYHCTTSSSATPAM
ncbi:hypothetical protein B9Z19DRAFT_1097424, partial [Tuber borchii]